MGYRRFQSTNHDRHYREWSSQHRVFHQVLPPSPRKHSFLVGNPVFTSGKFLIYMTSVDAILQDYQDNVIGRMPLPFLFNISGKGKPSNKPTKALRRAVRGVSAQQHSNYLSSHLNNLLKPDIHTDSVAPGIFPVVPNPSARGPQHIDNGTVQELMNPHVEVPVGDNRQTSKSVLFLFCSLSHSLLPRQQQSTALLGRHYEWSASGCRSLLRVRYFCTHQCFSPHAKYYTTIQRIRVRPP